MKYTIRIKRQKSAGEQPFYQEFSYENEGHVSVAGVLNELNRRENLTDKNGMPAERIAWDCGCMSRKCGACGMRINGVPRLACASFLDELTGETITIEPFRKFPVVRDLITDKRAIFEKIKQMDLYLQSEAANRPKRAEDRYLSAKCLMCGCCMEICPNFSVNNAFAGAAGAVNGFRALDQEEDRQHLKKLSKEYAKHFFEGCGKSLSCMEICPAEINIEELAARSNAVAIWKHKR